MRNTRRASAALLFCPLALFLSVQMFACPNTSNAVEVIFTIDSSQSTATWSGSYNGNQWEPQSAGSLSAPLQGHFLVDFDPTSSTPTALQFIGGHGYWELPSLYNAQPAVGGGQVSAPANLAGQSGNTLWAIRNLRWDFSSDKIESSNGVFQANQTWHSTSSGEIDKSSSGQISTQSYVGTSNRMTGGTWTLSESSPGSGDWTLVGTPSLNYWESFGGSSTIFNAAGTPVVAHAQYGAANSVVVQPTDVQAEALGGVAVVGGVTVDFGQSPSEGTFSVQQLPNETSLSQAAVAAAEADPVFALSTSSLSATPQIWEVDFSGTLDGPATLLFHYDSSLLPAGLDESTLGIWHYDSSANRWDFGGTVDPNADTIAFTTNSFSPFELGVAPVPEPCTLAIWSLFGVAGMTTTWLRRRKIV